MFNFSLSGLDHMNVIHWCRNWYFKVSPCRLIISGTFYAQLVTSKKTKKFQVNENSLVRKLKGATTIRLSWFDF